MTAINFTIRKKDNGYQLIASYKIGRKWKQKSKQGFRTKLEAKAYQGTMIKEIEARSGIMADKALINLTVKEFATEYILNSKNISYNTKRSYKNCIAHLHEIGDKKVADVTYLDLYDAVNEHRASHMPSSTNIFICVIKSTFNKAIKFDLITTSPAKNIEFCVDKRTEKRISLTDSEYNALLTAISPPKTNTDTTIYIACKTGMRFSEIMGLTWDCFDEKNKTLTIDKQYLIHGFSCVKNKYGVRTIPITDDLCKVLIKRRESDAFSKSSRIINCRSSSKNANKRIKRIVGDKFSIHSLRHTYATRLLAHGVDIRTVSALLGDTTETVMKNYVHYSDDMRMKVSGMLNDII